MKDSCKFDMSCDFSSIPFREKELPSSLLSRIAAFCAKLFIIGVAIFLTCMIAYCYYTGYHQMMVISRLEVQDVLFISVEPTESGSGRRDTKPIRKIISDPDRIKTFLDVAGKTRIGDRGDGNNANGARMQYIVDFRVALHNGDSLEFSVDYAGAKKPVQNLTGLIFPPWLNDSLAVWISQEIDR